MLHIWDAIEADFLRDYRIVLMEHLDDMSWRLFLVLLNNLSPYGAVSMQIRAQSEKETNTTSNEEDEKAANRFFSSLISV